MSGIRGPLPPPSEPDSAGAFGRFGDLSGIVYNVRTGRLVGGHQRTELFRAEEKPEIRVEKLPKPDARGTVAYGYVMIRGDRFS